VEHRRIGQLEVSVGGLGCNNFGMSIDEEQTAEVVRAALDAGINYFDTAEMYGKGRSEEWLGKALGARRSEVIVGTKWGHKASLGEGERGGDPERARRSLDASLRRLGTDYVDHYQLHTPDPHTPDEETLGVLAELRREGKVREIGCSNFSAGELDGAAKAASVRDLPPYASVQNHYSMLNRAPEKEGVLEACARHGLAFVPYFPLESGLLTGKYRLGEGRPEGSRLQKWGERATAFIDDDKLATVDRLSTWAEARGHTLLELAMSWLAGNPNVASVIAGATRPEQVRANAAALGWVLTDAERAQVEGLLRGPAGA
jgi:aryl-alcohol dehydrogenase-like predicted oxidoreductase